MNLNKRSRDLIDAVCAFGHARKISDPMHALAEYLNRARNKRRNRAGRTSK